MFEPPEDICHPPLAIATEWLPDVDLAATHGSSPLEIAAVVGVRGMAHEVQMENVHPLRLRLLLEIDRTGSISAAANACAIAQPSASMHLRTLEGAIGQRLVTRNRRGSSLTPAGKVVASHADRVLATLNSMRRALDTLDGRDSGELTLAASPTPSLVLLPRILRQYAERNPGVTVNLDTVPSGTVATQIVKGGADLGIAGEVPTPEPVVRAQILVDELMGIAPSGLLRLDGGSASLAELARHSLLVGAEGSSTRIATERCLARAGYRPPRVWQFSSYEAIKRAVMGGLGVSFVSRLLVRDEVQRGELIAFRVSGIERIARPIHVLQPGNRELTPESVAFMRVLAEAPWSPTELAPQSAIAPS
jgi:molybdate transport repressor ModE-like protein